MLILQDIGRVVSAIANLLHTKVPNSYEVREGPEAVLMHPLLGQLHPDKEQAQHGECFLHCYKVPYVITTQNNNCSFELEIAGDQDILCIK